jgi:hypothetical protein
MTLLQRARQEHSRSGFIETRFDARCKNCGHVKSHHEDRYGCEIEGPDVWVSGVNNDALVASGPCGCKSFEAEEIGTSLFLSWWADWSGTTYEIRHGLYGGRVVTTVTCEPLVRQHDLEASRWFYGLQKERRA